MYYFVTSLIANTVIALAKHASSTSGFDFTSLLPLVGVLIGGLVSAATSFFLNNNTNKQQLKRDEQAHINQMERERIAYERSLKDAQRERLRSAYKVILNATEEYEAVIHQLLYVTEGETEQTRNQRLNASLHRALSGMNEAMIEVTLEDVGDDVKTIFSDLRRAFHSYTYALDANANSPYPVKAFTHEEIARDKEKVIQKSKELTAFMQKHLKGLES